MVKTDIEIAQETKMEHIRDVAARLDVSEDDLELYGKYKAKFTEEYIRSLSDRKDGKLILVIMDMIFCIRQTTTRRHQQKKI